MKLAQIVIGRRSDDDAAASASGVAEIGRTFDRVERESPTLAHDRRILAPIAPLSRNDRASLVPRRFPMTIEMLGPSGSGKSTILREARAALLGAGCLGPEDLGLARAPHPSRLYAKQPLDDPAVRPLVRFCLELAARADWLPSQALVAAGVLADSCRLAALVARRLDGRPIVHDELLLHRAFSFLPRSDTWPQDTDRFFELVPLPAAAVVVCADPVVNRERLAVRGYTNVTRGLGHRGLDIVTERADAIARRAAAALRRLGVPVLELDSRLPVAQNADTLLAFVTKVRAQLDAERPEDYLRRKVIEVSGSFSTRGRRHVMRTQGVGYASLSVPGLAIDPSCAQRDTARRLDQFGIGPDDMAGRTVLDIGCHTGSVLFQLTAYGIRHGLGIEIDADKVGVANEIRHHLGCGQLEFEACDVETPAADALPTVDVTFALAVEKHLCDREAFYRMLGRVTRERLYFEANAGTDLGEVEAALHRHGFTAFDRRGFSTDDRDPRNHDRQLLVATRVAQG